ncbi:hypothetical protein EVAR_21110_1 [Eumeta japonica]|uniref:Uncharacterized protein n=1 Tax=Eumeta variegata TaxID=151549 RepID=A0A4C1VSI9_EUMVA|nr:hypothetical protein EVAR_21110_1 [Eumeta japonica]
MDAAANRFGYNGAPRQPAPERSARAHRIVATGENSPFHKASIAFHLERHLLGLLYFVIQVYRLTIYLHEIQERRYLKPSAHAGCGLGVVADSRRRCRNKLSDGCEVLFNYGASGSVRLKVENSSENSFAVKTLGSV